MASLILGASTVFGGCSAGLRYENAEKYTAGEGTVTETVTALDIEWIAGSVTVAYADVAGITFSEESTRALTDETTMRYFLDGTTLRIRYAKATGGCVNTHYPAKDLTVYVPRGVSLGEMEIETVSADIWYTDITTQTLDIESVSGNISASVKQTVDVDVDTVSGKLELAVFAVHTLDVSSVSGEISIVANTSQTRGDVESVSGRVQLALNPDCGFTVEYRSTSGRFTAELAGETAGKVWTYGDGTGRWDVQTTSGNIAIKRA